MSAAATRLAQLTQRSAAPVAVRLRPRWLRPLLLTAAVLAHAVALGGFLWFSAGQVTPLDDLKVEIIPQGETTTSTSVAATPEGAPVVSAAPAELAAPEPETLDDPDVAAPAAAAAAAASDLALPAPRVEAPDAAAVAVEQPRPLKIEDEKAASEARDEKKREKIRQAQRRRAILALKRAKAQAHARMLAAHSQIGAPAVHAGVRDGAGEAQHMSNAAYAALVSAEINRRKHYPERAREARREGAARVVFTIGSSGAIIARSIVRSSGDGDLDAAVLQMMSAAHPPPPPGGGFRGSITISFSLAR